MIREANVPNDVAGLTKWREGGATGRGKLSVHSDRLSRTRDNSQREQKQVIHHLHGSSGSSNSSSVAALQHRKSSRAMAPSCRWTHNTSRYQRTPTYCMRSHRNRRLSIAANFGWEAGDTPRSLAIRT